MRRPEPFVPVSGQAPLTPTAATGGHVSRATYRRRRLVALAGGLVAVVLVGVGAFATVTSATVARNLAAGAITRPGSTAAPAPEIPKWDGAVNVLIMGSDTRLGQTAAATGEADVAGARSDTLMVLHVNAAHTDATLVSIPRDTMLSMPACTGADGTVQPAQGVAQVNSAFGVSPYCTLDTVNQLTGLNIAHFVVVDFDGFAAITNAIGGVQVCLATAVDDPDSGLNLPAGESTVAGDQALAFVRDRHGIGDGSDLDRIRTQQTFLSALARKVKSVGVLTNPVALYDLADAASKSLHMDPALADPSALTGLAATLASVDLSHMVMVQMPVEAHPDDPNRVEPADSAQALWAALKADEPVALAPTADAPSSTPAPADASAGSSATQAAPQPSPSATPAPGATAPVPLSTDAPGQTAAQQTCAGSESG